MPSFRAQSRNPPCTLFFLAPFAEGFQFYFVTHTTLYRCARKIEGFARDDVAEMAFSKHIRCTLREINPFSHTVISSAARNLPCTLLFLAPFAKVFPFSAITHTALYRCARKIEDFARDDVAEMAFSKHIRCTLREINPFPPYRHFEHSEKSSLHSALSCSFRKSFPLFHCHTYDAISVCKKDPSASLGMTLREWRFPNISVVRYVK